MLKVSKVKLLVDQPTVVTIIIIICYLFRLFALYSLLLCDRNCFLVVVVALSRPLITMVIVYRNRYQAFAVFRCQTCYKPGDISKE